MIQFHQFNKKVKTGITNILGESFPIHKVEYLREIGCRVFGGFPLVDIDPNGSGDRRTVILLIGNYIKYKSDRINENNLRKRSLEGDYIGRRGYRYPEIWFTSANSASNFWNQMEKIEESEFLVLKDNKRGFWCEDKLFRLYK